MYMYVTLLFSYPCLSNFTLTFFILYVVLNSILICVNFYSFFYIHTDSLLYHYTYLYYKREFDYAKNDQNASNEDEYKLCAFNVAL